MNGNDAARRKRARRKAALVVADRHRAEWEAEYVIACRALDVEPRPRATLAEALHRAALERMRAQFYGGGALDDSIMDRAQEAMRKVREQ